ncbi:MAG: prepilin-type N-terminal cleavage/methylation domain-containing protein [Lachnospiraceae bacterium]|nr:prepilin-type N-terminal cleavage/methylation domain-containing protein [Lachnospiraceae bacterium]
MKNKIRYMRQSNKGVTLIELIVTVLIMSIIVGVIGLFISSSRNSYVRISNETAMQAEADIAMTFLTDIAEEASAFRIETENMLSSDGGTREYDVLCIQVSDPTPYYCFIVHDVVGEELRFCKVSHDDSANLLWVEGTSEDNINNIDIKATLEANNINNPSNKRCFLAKYITGFDTVVPPEKSGLLRVSIELKYGGNTYTANKNISSRNIV